MKATTIIAAAILSLLTIDLFAAKDNVPVTPNTDYIASYTVKLAPTTPAEATFEEIAPVEAIDLMPSTPVEATFDEMPFEMTTFVNLAPVTPAVAEFDTDADNVTIDLTMLRPTSPLFADFE